ncbi:MAG TPA: MBL fold metallo-hydrolase [Capsulimonadaceae bacterium]|nr:MBL fold metallo-hydrolase [Capsulimonadaceae bacterium]
MSDEKLYLRPNVVVEPLIDHWYAWAHLLSPATAAMNIDGRHMKIMQSYINAPQVHASAVKNPAMLGGPFIDYETNRVDDIKCLMQYTREKRGNMLEFADAIKQLDKLLEEEAKGYSLEPLYPKVPDILRGYVEMVYDLNNSPSFRVIEALLYHSDFHDTSSQSMMLSLIDQDHRPFILSTPRLEGPNDVHLQIPFSSAAIDELFKMKKTPQTYAFIKEQLGIPDKYDAKFQTFLTPDPPAPYAKYEGDGARWRYFGHACILLETKHTSILLDPVLSYTYDSEISRYTYADLPDEIDYVLITHNHQDHILMETMLQIRHKVKNVVVPRCSGGSLQDPSLKLMLLNHGFKNVIEIGELERIDFDRGSITALPFLGEHSDLDVRTKAAHLVKVDGHTVLFAADSCNIEPRLYEHLHRVLGDVEILFLGMECDGAPLSWLYGPLLTTQLPRSMDQSRRLAGSNYERGIDIVNTCNCKEAYVYAMGQEPWLNYIMSKKYTEESNPIIASNKLIADCKGRGIVAERLFGEKELFLS